MPSKKQVRTHSEHIYSHEKIRELYRFAEFGRLSSGLFHDIINPLTAVLLYIEQARSNHNNIPKVKKCLEQAYGAAHHMERFIAAVKQQLHSEKTLTYFCPCAEIRLVGDILSHKARLAGVQLSFSLTAAAPLYGSTTHWTQIMLNLISNAIDAYENSERKRCARIVSVTCSSTNAMLECTVSDRGIGIARCHLHKIFDAFFSTKIGCMDKGAGVGLSIAKHLVEKEFGGTIIVHSAPRCGTTFTVSVPVPQKL
jgi:signal transduction histidine kinase